MTEALKNFATIVAANKVVILGEMMELGDYAKAEHEKIAALVKGMSLEKRIFTGVEVRAKPSFAVCSKPYCQLGRGLYV